jgi:hypothetical protein
MLSVKVDTKKQFEITGPHAPLANEKRIELGI